MDYSKENLKKIEIWLNNYIKNMEDKYKDSQTAIDKINHIKNVVKLVNLIEPNNEMALVAAYAHDIGRFGQLELLGNFNDGIVLHHNLGEDIITRAVFKGELEISNELNCIRQVIQYHGREQFLPYKPELIPGTKELIDIVSRVDEIENGCIGATGYLLREAEEDAKGYKVGNPELDMKTVSPDVWQCYKKGEKFDKMKLCKTYADYTLFASVLSIKALKEKDRELAKSAMNLECNGYKTALDGYRDIFSKLIEPEYSKKAFEVLKGFYYDRNYKYEDKEISNTELELE